MTHAPVAGSPASNQYGTFAVHFASEKQQAFIRSLAAKRVLPADVPSQHAQALSAVERNELNKKHASRTIDWLMTLPTRAPVATTTEVPDYERWPASEKQVALIRSLLTERIGWKDSDATVETFARGNNEGIWAALRVEAGLPVSKRAASAAIDHLFGSGKRDRPTADAAATAGMHRTADGNIYRVYLGQQSGRMLVKQVVKTGGTWIDRNGIERDEYEYEYLGAAAYKLPADARPLPLEEAKVWGRMTASCCVCAARLDVPESVDAGIGPVCGRKYA